MIGENFHYYNSPDGSMTKNNTIGGFDIDDYGDIVGGTGWLKDQYSGKYYYYSDGEMKTGWVKYGDSWYYMDPNGEMATGWRLVNGIYYYLNSTGEMATGWVNDGNGWSYLYGSGAMTWSNTVGGYHLNANGIMVTGTGWIFDNGLWYYLDHDKVVTGWLFDKGNWYYLYPKSDDKTHIEGSMAENTIISGWKVDSSGKWIDNNDYSWCTDALNRGLGPITKEEYARRMKLLSGNYDVEYVESNFTGTLAINQMYLPSGIASYGGKVDAANLIDAFKGALTGWDTILSTPASGVAAGTFLLAKNAYGAAISNSSSKVEMYRKMLDVANKADKFRLMNSAANSWGTKLGIVGNVIGGGLQISSDVTNGNYSDKDKAKAVAVDVLQTGASIGSILVISAFVPGVGWGIAGGIALGFLASTTINYIAQEVKDEWIDGGN